MRLQDLLQFSSVVIQCHDFPDADTIASAYGVYAYLKKNGCEARMIYGGKKKITKPNLLLMVEHLDIPLEYVTELPEAELLLTVDCMHGEANVTPFPAKVRAAIDHHYYCGPELQYMEIRSDYGSCASLVAELLVDEGTDYNEASDVATALYYGLYTDTNSFGELCHPADRNLRDFAKFNAGVFSLLKNSNLSLHEMQIAGAALKEYRYYVDERFAIVQAKSCDPNILGFISDLLLQVDVVDVCVVFCEIPNGIKLSVRSCVPSVCAVEVAQYLTEGIGSGGGHVQKAGGFIGKESIPEVPVAMYREFVTERMRAYYKSFTVLYAKDAPVDTSELPLYRKCALVSGYLPSTDIYEAGTKICVRTLEADERVEASEDIYLKFGVFGEVYPMQKDIFEQAYLRTEQAPMFQPKYRPMVIEEETSETKELLPLAKGCIPKPSAPIYAVQLKNAVKLYTRWDVENYMYGKAGDYLAVRQDDPLDVYIIKNDIFQVTYELV